MSDVFDQLGEADASRVVFVRDQASGLKAMIAIDDLTLGPAAGGIRTLAYHSVAEAIADAQRLAAAMTLKCAIAGLDAGGAKTVVLDHPGFRREAGFRRLGEYIEELNGLYRCAGDLGTTPGDLQCVAESTSYVNVTGQDLGLATAQGLMGCLRACAAIRGRDGLSGLKVAIQGCGLIGSAVARGLKAEGAEVFVGDIDESRARALADEIGAQVSRPDEILTLPVDILSPCASGGTITGDLLPKLKAWAICGGANNQLDDRGMAPSLAAAGILYVPDFLASAGAVIAGIAPVIMDVPAAPLIGRLGTVALEILQQSTATGEDTVAIAARRARTRIEDAKKRRISFANTPGEKAA